jgi:hypothetical protein
VREFTNVTAEKGWHDRLTLVVSHLYRLPIPRTVVCKVSQLMRHQQHSQLVCCYTACEMK